MVEEFEQSTETVQDTVAPELGRAVREGSESGRRAAHDVWSALGIIAAKGAYQGAYYVAYGVTFGAVFVGHFLPRESSVAVGLREGTDDALSDFRAWEEHADPPAEPARTSETEVRGDVAGMGAAEPA